MRRFSSIHLAAFLAGTAFVAPAHAQIAPPGPVRDLVDGNGVDLFSGRMMLRAPGLTIGGAQGMSYARVFRQTTWTDDLIATLEAQGALYIVSQGLRSDSFTFSNGAYTSTEGNGARLTVSGDIHTYTAADGTVIRFNRYYGNGPPVNLGTMGQVTDITRPDGTRYVFAYNSPTYCSGTLTPTGCSVPETRVSRLRTVESSFGYRIVFTHASLFPGLRGEKLDEWFQVVGASVTNLAGASGSPVASNSYAVTATTQTVTDAMGRAYLYTNSGGDLTGIRLPGSASDDVTIAYTSGRVSSVTTAAGATSYSASDASGVRTVTVTDPLNHATIYKFDIASKRLNEVTDANGDTTAMQYDTLGRMTRVTQPEGNYVQLTYDGRGNVTQQRAVAKTPGTPADIVTTASYPATCTDAKTCNQPASTTDARGNVTNYTYDSGHGGLLTVTAPAPTTGAVRPQTRYSYSSLQAYYRNSSGSIVASGIPVVRLTGVSQCQTTASCAGAADEVKTTVSYGPQAAGTGNNLLPVSTSSGSGNGSLTATTAFTYDEIGNLTHVDGPLGGTADTSRLIYNAAREQVGIIGPDPDGGGALKNRARRLTIDGRGLVTKVETGTTSGQTDTAWAAFAPAEAVDVAYDAARRPATRTLTGGGAAYALTQTSYDAASRVDCVATRMNPAQFGSLPASACTHDTAGSFGPDRISKIVYDNANRPTQLKVAVGTGDAANERTLTYTDNGRLATLKDAENNLTTFEYDGFDRLSKTRFPNTPKGSGTSSMTDYEQLSYDANSNVTSRRNRAGQNNNFFYDALNRVTSKNLPSPEANVSYDYDNLSRLTRASQAGGMVLQFTWDALSRNLTQVGPQGTVASEWDVAGRRTKLTYPGSGLYLNYDYLVTGEMTKIRENGAASGVGVLATYAYDNLGRRTSLTRGNGTLTSYTFDAVSRLASLTQNLSGTANDLTITNGSYNPASQIVGQTRSNDAYAFTPSNGNVASVANGLNQLTSIGGSPTNHDTTGNLTLDPTTGKTYGYSSENLLTSASGGVTLAYDPAMRLHQLAAGTTTRFAWDGLAMIAEYNGADAVQRRYVHGPGVDEPLVQYEGSGTTDRRFLHADERGSIVAISNASGAMLNVNKYDEFGPPGSSNAGRFQYTGQMWLPEVGLYHYKARAYAPHLGRFLQTDPIGYPGGMNLYAYVGNDPVNFIDPLGLCDADMSTDTTNDDCEIVVIGKKLKKKGEGGGAGDVNPFTLVINLPQFSFLGALGLSPGLKTPFLTICPIVNAEITGVGPEQAAGDQRTAISGERGRDIDPAGGGVAIDPLDFGVSFVGPFGPALSSVAIYPIWALAQRPSNRAPAIPRGLPSRGPYHPIDVMGPASVRNQPGLQLDLYRYSNQSAAFSSTREVPVLVVIPSNKGLTCPSG